MNDQRRWLEVLGLEPGATREQLDRAYRDLVKVWHPDRFQSDPSLRLKAQEKLRELNAAYEGLKRYGIPPRDPSPPPRATVPPAAVPAPPATPAGRFVRPSELRLFGAVLLASAAVVGLLLSFGMQRDTPTTTATTPTDFSLTAAPRPPVVTEPKAVQRSQAKPVLPTPPPEVVEPPAPVEPPAVVPPAPKPPAPAAGALMVISEPAGATVYLNDARVGSTPLTVGSLIPGAYRVRVELGGYAAWSSSVPVEAGASEKLIVSLDRR